MHAGVGTEAEAAVDDGVPIALGEVVEVVATDAVLDDTVEDAGIEVVACSDGADGDDGLDGIVLGDGGAVELYALGTAAVDEAGAVEGCLLAVYLGSLTDAVEHGEVLVGTTHDIGIFEVLDDGAHKFDGLALVVATEVDVVVDDGACTTGLIEQGGDLVAHARVDGIVGAEEDDVVALNGGALPVGAAAEGVFVEGVGGVVVVVEEGKRYGRFAFGVFGEVSVVNAVGAEEGAYDTAHRVVAYLADEA